jgi:hypothetical protein
MLLLTLATPIQKPERPLLRNGKKPEETGVNFAKRSSLDLV